MSAYYNDSEPYAVEWTRNLIGEGCIAPGVVDGRSIKEVVAADVRGATQAHFFSGIGCWSYALRLAGWPDDLEVWTGSCPCQPFSSAGAGGGFEDERHLWPDWFRLIGECRPAVVFGEQVASPDGLKWLDLVSADLEGAGYAVGAADLCAAGVGAPHLRQRLFFVAYATEQGWNPRWGSRLASHGGATPWLEPRRLREALRVADAYGRAGDEGRALAVGSDRGGDAQPWAGSGGGSCVVELADPHGERQQGQRLQLRQRRSRKDLLEALGRGETGWVGNADREGGGRYAGAIAATQAGFSGAGLQHRHVGDGALASGPARGVGDASCSRLQVEQREPGVPRSAAAGDAGQAALGAGASACALVDAAGDGREQGGRDAAGGAGTASEREAAFYSDAGATRGFWSEAEWRYCLDERWRATEPGVEPLAHGTSGRVVVVRPRQQAGSTVQEAHWYSRIGALKGFGNAIVSPVAATFIRAFMDVVVQ